MMMSLKGGSGVSTYTPGFLSSLHYLTQGDSNTAPVVPWGVVAVVSVIGLSLLFGSKR